MHAAPALIDYVQTLVDATRQEPSWLHGLSPRAALALLAAARAWALIDGRDLALPEDVQAVFAGVAAHRLRLAQGNGHASADDLDALLRRVPLP